MIDVSLNAPLTLVQNLKSLQHSLMKVKRHRTYYYNIFQHKAIRVQETLIIENALNEFMILSKEFIFIILWKKWKHLLEGVQELQKFPRKTFLVRFFSLPFPMLSACDLINFSLIFTVGVFLGSFRNLKNSYSEEHLWTAASE